MREKQEAVHIFRELTRLGYLIEHNGDRWKATEPKDRPMPQQICWANTLREVRAWADGCESVRFANGIAKR